MLCAAFGRDKSIVIIIIIIMLLYMYIHEHALYRVGQKTGLFLRVDNFATVRDKKACDVKSFQFLARKMYKTRMSVKLNILCIVCVNIQCI